MHAACGDRGYDGRVDAAGEKGADRDVRDHLPLYGIAHQIRDHLPRFFIGIGVRGGGKIPVAHLLRALPGENLIMTGENFAHAGKNAVAGCACRTDGQKLQQAVFIDGGRDIRVAEERFWLGAKDQCAARGAVEERFGTGTVTVQKQFTGSAVPDRKGKNAVQAADKIPPIVQIGAENDFRVGSCGKSIPGGEKRRQQFVGVVDLAIVDDRAGAFPILPDYGLTAARNIADAESGVGKPHMRV